jgi:hypothetical protein
MKKSLDDMLCILRTMCAFGFANSRCNCLGGRRVDLLKLSHVISNSEGI